MLNPVLKEQGKTRLVYATSVGYRIVGFGTAAVILLSIAAVSSGDFFSRDNIFPFILSGACLLAGLYQERWTFDKESNRIEKNVGLLFLSSRKTIPLDGLLKVVLHEQGVRYSERPRVVRWSSRRTALLFLVDRDGGVHRMDHERRFDPRGKQIGGQAVRLLRILLEDDTGEPADSTHL